MRFMSPGHINLINKFIDTPQGAVKPVDPSQKYFKYKKKSPNMQQIQNKSLPYNDSSELLKKAKQLELQLKALDDEYLVMNEDNKELIEQNNYMKDINKSLFNKIRDAEALQTQTGKPNELLLDVDSQLKDPQLVNRESSQVDHMDFGNETSVGDIHSMYQDLFLSDMKKEVEDAQSEFQQSKQETNSAQREISILKKEQSQLQATLKRYRNTVQEMSPERNPKTNKGSFLKSQRDNKQKKRGYNQGGNSEASSIKNTLPPKLQKKLKQADSQMGRDSDRYVPLYYHTT